MLTQAWRQRGVWARALWPLSLLHGLLVMLRRRLYNRGILKSARLPVPVVVVGNVIAGGAGKTPLVIALVRHLQGKGHRPGVISRGYGRLGEDCLEVLPTLNAAQTGDEPLLIRKLTKAPVFVARRRVEAARALLSAHPDTTVIICDDGLQHYALQRDLNVAVFDERGIGNGWLLPAGPLREPWPQGWARESDIKHRAARLVRPVDLVLHTGANRPAGVFKGFTANRALADEALTADGRRVSLHSLRGERLIALAGIAKPQAFFDMLNARGIQLERTLALPDHVGPAELAALDLFPDNASPSMRVLCTEKDAVKLFAIYPDAGLRLLAVPLLLVPEQAFISAIDASLRDLLTPF
jgi:tetraacyldisaccharide 4'-kinase